MKTKYIIPILLLCAIGLNAQGKVGINTEDPQQTLDINGTLRLKEPKDLTTQNNTDILPIGRDPQTKQIVSAIDEEYSPFKVVNYSFEIEKLVMNPQDDAINEDWVNDIDLKVPTDKYTMILTQASFLNAKTNSPTLIPIMGFSPLKDGSREGLNVLYNAQQGDRGFIDDASGNKYSGYMLAGQPQVMLYPNPRTGTWKFYADYPNIAPISFLFEDQDTKNPPTRVKRFNGRPDPNNLSNYPIRFFDNYVWKITAIIIDNNLIKTLDIRANNNNSSFGVDTDQPETELTN